MHKPRRRTKYFERFYFEYEGILYLSKKNCCEKLGFEYGSVLGYRHTNNCSFTEALDHFMEIREQNQFVFRNRNWLNLDNCCEFYGVNKFTVRHYQYDYGDTIQEALEKAIKYTKQIKFVYKGKTYPSLAKCCREMGIPESTVRKCMAETGKTGAVALTHCIKKAEERKYSNPSPFFYREKETSVYKGYKQDKIEMRGDRAEMSDFPLYLNTVAGGLDRRDQTIGGFSFVVKIYAVPVVEIIG